MHESYVLWRAAKVVKNAPTQTSAGVVVRRRRADVGEGVGMHKMSKGNHNLQTPAAEAYAVAVGLPRHRHHREERSGGSRPAARAGAASCTPGRVVRGQRAV